MPIELNEVSAKAMGGTELMAHFLRDNIDPELLDKFQIIPSRIRELDKTRRRIFYAHDLPHDPESKPLENRGWEKFNKLVFVSHWQQQRYIDTYQIPWSKTLVLQNAIEPIEIEPKDYTGQIRLIYHTTPHRGLNILAAVVQKLAEKYGDAIHLDVYSSFQIYGWPERDKEYEAIFKKIQDHPQMTYHATVSNEEVRQALAKAHIFAYPSIWPETSCICLMEAMSAGLVCVHPDFAALPETASNLTDMYTWHEDMSSHGRIIYAALDQAISFLQSNPAPEDLKTGMAKTFADLFYGRKLRAREWESFLRSIEIESPDMPVEPVFTYRT